MEGVFLCQVFFVFHPVFSKGRLAETRQPAVPGTPGAPTLLLGVQHIVEEYLDIGHFFFGDAEGSALVERFAYVGRCDGLSRQHDRKDFFTNADSRAAHNRRPP